MRGKERAEREWLAVQALDSVVCVEERVSCAEPKQRKGKKKFDWGEQKVKQIKQAQSLTWHFLLEQKTLDQFYNVINLYFLACLLALLYRYLFQPSHFQLWHLTIRVLTRV